MRKFLNNNWPYLIGWILVLFIFSLRYFHLTILPVFADEAIYIRWAQVMKAEETLRFLPLSDGKEPLFMWVIIPFLKFINNPLIAGRIVSVFSGFGTLVGISFLTYLLFKNKKISLIAAFIYSLSPFTFFFDRLSTVDSMLSMFGVWTFIFSFLAFKKQRLDYAMIAGFFLGGAWLTKSPAIFFALMLPTLYIFLDSSKKLKDNIPIILKSAALFLVTIAIGYAMFNILRLGPNFHLIASRNLDYVYPLSHIFERPMDPLETFFTISFVWIGAMGPWAIYILSLLGIFLGYKKHWKELLILLIWFLFPITIQSEFAKTFTARYILFSLPYLVIISASVFELNNKIIRYIIYAVLALFVVQALIFNIKLVTNPEKANLPRSERSGYLEEWTAGQGIYETANYLIQEQANHPNENIVIGTEGYFGTLPDGLQMYLNATPSITAIGVGLGFSDLPKPLAESYAFGNKTYFLVNKSRFGDWTKMNGLKLIEEYPKAVKPDSLQDSLLFFRVVDEKFKIQKTSTGH